MKDNVVGQAFETTLLCVLKKSFLNIEEIINKFILNIKLLKNIFLYGIGDFIVTGVSAFLLIPLYLKFLSTADYGIYNILNNNTTLFIYIFQFGIVSAFSRIYFLKKGENLEKKYTWNIVCLHFVFSFFLIVFYIIFKSFIINRLSPSISGSSLVYYSPMMAFLSFLPALYYIYLRVEEKADKFVQYQILTVTLILLLLLLSYFFYEINLLSILISFILSNFIVWVIVFFNLKFSFSFDINLKDITETLHFAFPIFISYIAYFFISKYSIIILQKYVSLGEIGRFSLGQQIASIPSLLTIAITKAVQPVLFSSNSDDELKIKAQKFDKNYKLIMIWVVGSLIFSLDILFSYFLPLSYNPILNCTKYLLLINLIYNFAIVENTILLYKMESKFILVITICGSVLNVVLSNILIKTYLLNGVLISMAIAFSVNFCLGLYFSRKHIRLNYDIKTIAVCLGIILFYILISSSNLIKILSFYKISFSIACFFVLTVIISLIYKKKYAVLKN